MARFPGLPKLIQSLRATKRWDWPVSTVPVKRLLPLADQLRTSIQQFPPTARTYSRKETGFVGARRVGVAGGSTFWDEVGLLVPRFGIGSFGLPPNFQATMKKTTSAAIPVSAKAIQRRSSRRCCLEMLEVRLGTTGSRGSSPSAPKRELNSST